MMMTSVTNGIEPIRPFGGFKQGEIIMVSSPLRSTGKSMNWQMLKSRVSGTVRWNINAPLESKYKFSRKTWYKVPLFADDRFSRIDWCTTHFGAQPKNPDAWTRWYYNLQSMSLVFRDLKDYQLYLLKWS